MIEHSFEIGWKLEALNPINKTQICPATVLYVLNSRYFVVEIDDLANTEEMCRIRFSCYSGSKCIFPTKWCRSKGINVTPPNGKVYLHLWLHFQQTLHICRTFNYICL